MFADDGVPFAEKMNAYIEREFADVPGLHQHLLQAGQGLSTKKNRSVRIDPPEKIIGRQESTRSIRDRVAR